MEQEKITDWRDEILPSKETLKLKDGEEAEVTFLDEGSKRENKDFGNSIAFLVMKKGEETPKFFFVASRNFTFLSEIKALGKLAGKNFKISRKGRLKSDTRYSINPI